MKIIRKEAAEPKLVKLSDLKCGEWFITSSPSSSPQCVYCRELNHGQNDVECFRYGTQNKHSCRIFLPSDTKVIPIPAPTIIIGSEDENKGKE